MSTRSPARNRLRARRNASSAVGRGVTSARSVTGGFMRRVWLVPLSTILVGLFLAPAAQADRVLSIRGAAAPGPARYDRIRVIEQGPRHARHVLVLVPGTQPGAAYFRPVARDIVPAAAGLARVVGRPPREPPRGPLGSRPGAGRPGDPGRPV